MANSSRMCPGALWTLGQLDGLRTSVPLDWVRVVVAVDPSGGSAGEGNDEQGIVVCGIDKDGVGYVLAGPIVPPLARRLGPARRAGLPRLRRGPASLGGEFRGRNG